MNSQKVTRGKPVLKEFFILNELLSFSNSFSLDITCFKSPIILPIRMIYGK